MPPAPAVQSLNDIVSQLTAAYAPESQSIDQSINQNEQSGQGQIAGLNSAKDQAFSTINQNANNRGMFFSGFTPNAEATYTGSTYLPALAKLQNTIASTRNTLLGQKATLASNANTQALSTQKDEQDQLDAYNLEVHREQAAAAAAAQQQQFEAQQNAANRAASVAAASAKASVPTASQQLSSDTSAMAAALKGQAGKDGFVSPQSFAQARNEWVSAGYSAADFNSRFKSYANLTYGSTAKTNYGL